MINIVLVRPEVAGNVGAIARVMANFGFSKLVIIDPKCDILGKEAQDRAKHAKSILKKAKIGGDELLESFDYKIGTTGRLGTDYNLLRSPLSPSEYAQKMSGIKRRNVAIIFGPEGQGLSNEFLRCCDFTVTIPTSPRQPIMNLSHAVSLVLYELFLVSSAKKQGSHIAPIGKKEKEHLLKLIYAAIERTPAKTAGEQETQRKLWARIVGKSMLTSREAAALFGFFRRFEK